MLRRQILLGPIGALSLLLPGVAATQTAARVAWVSPTSAADASPFLDELRQGLREYGHIEGRNLVLDAYWGENSTATTEKRAAEAVAANPRAIVSQGAAVYAVRQATRSIPIVFGFSGDPVQAGLVQSMAQPGGNLTGISYMTLELVGKRMQLLRETLPSIRRVAVIAFPQHAGDQGERRASETAASVLGLTLEYFEARSVGEMLAALATIEKTRHEAVMLFPVQTVITGRERISEWALRTRIPTISGWAQFAEGGNLMSYGPNLRAASFRLAYYVDRILKGSKPSDLPVEQPVRVELVINARTAKALGITIPQTILLRADRVIE